MGVDYSGHHGIGVKIYTKELEEESEYFEDFLTYLDDIVTEDYFYFEVGDCNYSGEDNDLYLCIKDPFNGGLELFNKRVNDLFLFLKENEIEHEKQISSVGGLEIW